MNINPVGISAYGKTDATRKNPDATQRAQEAFALETEGVKNGAVEQADTTRIAKSEQEKAVTMARRQDETSSALAVMPDSDFTQLLSVEERQAIETLFAKYTETRNSGVQYDAEGTQTHAPRLGANVDYRV